MPATEQLISPQLVTLQQQLEIGNIGALEAFWQDVIEQGTPLIERIVGEDAHSLVTFLWRATEGTTTAIVNTALAEPTRKTAFLQRMTHLRGTDLWYKTFCVRNELRTTYHLSTHDSGGDFDDFGQDRVKWRQFMATFQPDPLNKDPFPRENPTSSTVTLPDAPQQPWITARTGVPAGEVQYHQVHSAILGNDRDVWVYLPPGYPDRANRYSFLLLLDGWAYLNWIPTPTILDNLLAEGGLPPLVAVMLGSPDRNSELLCNDRFVGFLTHELVPWIHQTYHVSSDPSQTIVGGSSFGGLCAAFVGLRQPNLFGNVLSQSGSFWWNPDADGEAEWLAREYVTSPTLPLRFYLDAGLCDIWSRAAVRPPLLVANRHMRNVLQAKRYPVHYAEFYGGHDYVCWRGTLSDGLLALIGKRQS